MATFGMPFMADEHNACRRAPANLGSEHCFHPRCACAWAATAAAAAADLGCCGGRLRRAAQNEGCMPLGHAQHGQHAAHQGELHARGCILPPVAVGRIQAA